MPMIKESRRDLAKDERMDEPKLPKLRALIVDDNVHMRDLLKRLLGSRGVRYVEEAVDGGSALKMLASTKFDLVLLDLEMKPVDGIEFTRAIRAAPGQAATIPIIMVSGHADLKHVRQARDAGVNEFLVKPVTPKSLFDRIHDIFERPRAFVSSAGYNGPERRRKALDKPVQFRRKTDPV